MRTGSLRTRTVVSVLGMLTVLLVALGFTVQLVLGERLRTQIEERLQDRASAATALMGAVDSDDLAQRLSAEGVSVLIESADGQAVVAGPTPDQLRKGPGSGLAPAGVGAGLAPAGSGDPADAGAGSGDPAAAGAGSGDPAGAGAGSAADGTPGAAGVFGGSAAGSSPGAAEVASGSAAGSSPAAVTTTSPATTPLPAAAATPTVTASTFTSDAQIVTLVTSLSDGSTLTLTADASSVEQTLVQLRWVMAGASVVFLLVAAAALVVVVRASLRPLESMTGVARSIARGDRGQRLRPERADTEIGRVALAFDEMLDGVEGAERAARVAEGTARAAERAALGSERTARAAEQQARAAEETAREAEERVRSFVSDAAHELRTPVAGMQAAADTLVRASVDRGERDRLASHVVREAGRASRLIDDMLMMARVDRGLELERRPTDVARMVADEAERQRIRRPALRLDVSVPSSPVVADVDPERLAQVVANLVDNAARMTGGAGPVGIRVACVSPGPTPGDAPLQSAVGGAGASGDGPVAVTVTSAAHPHLRIEVSDTGPGVPEAERERIFDRLVRLDDSRRAGAGAGLGLPIARGIARAHGGDLTCEPPAPTASTTGPAGMAEASAADAPGATFVLTIPG